jgi:hypothetical protein
VARGKAQKGCVNLIESKSPQAHGYYKRANIITEVTDAYNGPTSPQSIEEFKKNLRDDAEKAEYDKYHAKWKEEIDKGTIFNNLNAALKRVSLIRGSEADHEPQILKLTFSVNSYLHHKVMG